MTPGAFDAAAERYDAEFTDHRLGRALRGLVRQHLADAFPPGSHVLELGCGTGEDAVWLAERGVRVTAVDASPGMLDQARRKAARTGTSDRLRFVEFDLSAPGNGNSIGTNSNFSDPGLRLGPPGAAGTFDGAFSNFGALNCLPDRRPLAESLAAAVRPGGRVVTVVMGRFCPWEVAAFLARGRPRQALRRVRQGQPAPVGGGATIRVWYVSPRELRREFAPWFRPLATAGVGVVLPPSDFRRLVDRWPRVFARLEALDRRVARTRLGPWLADHHVTTFERCPA